jgi:hypothetical protein
MKGNRVVASDGERCGSDNAQFTGSTAPMPPMVTTASTRFADHFDFGGG